MNDARLAAFVEYVLRPLSEDWRLILDRLEALHLGPTQETIRRLTVWLALWHLCGELIRAISYVTIVWIVCHTVQGYL